MGNESDGGSLDQLLDSSGDPESGNIQSRIRPILVELATIPEQKTIQLTKSMLVDQRPQNPRNGQQRRGTLHDLNVDGSIVGNTRQVSVLQIGGASKYIENGH